MGVPWVVNSVTMTAHAASFVLVERTGTVGATRSSSHGPSSEHIALRGVSLLPARRTVVGEEDLEFARTGLSGEIQLICGWSRQL